MRNRLIACIFVAMLLLLCGCSAEIKAPAPPPTTIAVVSPEETPAPDVTPKATATAIRQLRYELNAEERDMVERVVMAEAGGESDTGQRAVAQCILNAAEHDEIRPHEVFEVYQYAKPAESATERVAASVAAVFDDGETVTTELILWFYAPAHCTSTWHERQRFVMEIGGHRFFAEQEE